MRQCNLLFFILHFDMQRLEITKHLDVHVVFILHLIARHTFLQNVLQDISKILDHLFQLLNDLIIWHTCT
jgi:hypothetical protein